MKLLNTACAGTGNKEDLFVTVSPAEQEIKIIVRSSVKALFGEQIESAVRALLEQYRIGACRVEIDDHSALDYVVRARVETALLRALEGGEA